MYFFLSLMYIQFPTRSGLHVNQLNDPCYGGASLRNQRTMIAGASLKFETEDF